MPSQLSKDGASISSVRSTVDTPSPIPFPPAPPSPDSAAAGSDKVRLVPSASDQPSATGAVTIPVPQTVPHYQGESAS
jgi:hypothetical protein